MRSAHEGELKPDRGDPESNGLELITEMELRVYFTTTWGVLTTITTGNCHIRVVLLSSTLSSDNSPGAAPISAPRHGALSATLTFDPGLLVVGTSYFGSD